MRFFLILPIRLYQIAISPLMGSHCRFYPSCSQYAVESIQKFGVVRGTWLAMSRIARCHPGHPGGVDLVPAAECSPVER